MNEWKVGLVKAVIRRRKSIVVTSGWEQIEMGQVRITPKRVYVGNVYPKKFDRLTGKNIDRFRPKHGDILLRVMSGDEVILETEASHPDTHEPT
jgi:hypothetical protein